MQPFVFERRQVLPVTLQEAWRFFCDPRNLSRITPPSMRFRIVSPETDRTYAGQIISYTVRPLFGITMSWVTEITHLNEPFFFVDEQRFGPYRFWHHQHHFLQTPEGTEVHDLIHYLLPGVQLPRLVNRLVVLPRLKRIFDYRSQALAELFTRPGRSG